MPQSAAKANIVEDQTVVASLQPGPNGTVRLSYEYPDSVLEGFSLGRLGPLGESARIYASPVIELDREKLREMKFSQEELAEIGFSLVARLSGLVRY